MLEDFVDDLKRTIQQRLDNAVQTLKGNVDPSRPRGVIEAYETALIDIDELLTHYATPESVPEQLDLEPRRTPPSQQGGRRLYGRAA